jgi:hypothetical protein
MYKWFCPDCEEEHEDPEFYETCCRRCGRVVQLGTIDRNDILLVIPTGFLSDYEANWREADKVQNALDHEWQEVIIERTGTILSEKNWIHRGPKDAIHRARIIALQECGFWDKNKPVAVRNLDV